MDYICSFINVNKSYNDREIFRNLNFKIEKGEMLAITGKSGSGKSTILNMIGLLDNADSGYIELFGKEISKLSKSERKIFLRNKISYLFQNFALIDDETISKNLEIPLFYSKFSKKLKEASKKEALKEVGLDIPLNTKVYSLSGGEQQRVALARILLKQNEIILADEPTGSLDNDSRDMVLNTLIRLKEKGMTIVIVTHDNYISSFCDRVINIDNLKSHDFILEDDNSEKVDL